MQAQRHQVANRARQNEQRQSDQSSESDFNGVETGRARGARGQNSWARSVKTSPALSIASLAALAGVDSQRSIGLRVISAPA